MTTLERMSAFDRSPRPSPSRPGSIFSAQSIDTLVADQGYRGYPSEEAYLNALKQWAQSRMFFETDEQLRGFYGTKTLESYRNQPGMKTREKKSKDQRRATVAQLTPVSERNTSTTALSRQSTKDTSISTVDEANPAPASPESKGSKLKRVFTRRKTVV